MTYSPGDTSPCLFLRRSVGGGGGTKGGGVRCRGTHVTAMRKRGDQTYGIDVAQGSARHHRTAQTASQSGLTHGIHRSFSPHDVCSRDLFVRFDRVHFPQLTTIQSG